jgi:hypothetical protein
MILPAAFVFGAHLLLPVAERVPVLNIDPVCEGIARQGGRSFHDPEIAKQKRRCMQSEQEVRAQLVKLWSTFSERDKRACIAEATTGGEASYTELLTCLQMAHDVRNLKNGPPPPHTSKPRR